MRAVIGASSKHAAFRPRITRLCAHSKMCLGMLLQYLIQNASAVWNSSGVINQHQAGEMQDSIERLVLCQTFPSKSGTQACALFRVMRKECSCQDQRSGICPSTTYPFAWPPCPLAVHPFLLDLVILERTDFQHSLKRGCCIMVSQSSRRASSRGHLVS